ncbi:hypothetical protein F6Y02_00145 [Bacillus megaterium]|nr:hypothetical protein [Priestia megaterium]
MNSIQTFFQSIRNGRIPEILVTLACVAVFPSLFMPTVSGVLLGFVAATAINYALGLKWKPLRQLISTSSK